MNDLHRRIDDSGFRWILKNWQLLAFIGSLVAGATVTHKSMSDANRALKELQGTSAENHERLIRLETRTDEMQASIHDIREDVKELTRIVVGAHRDRR